MDTIFYSWQSDLDAGVTRNLIQDALRQAIKELNREPDLAIDATIDRATDKTTGAVDIPNEIMAKIAKARAFLADVSIINGELVVAARSNPKLCPCVPDRSPNPNVLFELGYAAGSIGWNRTIMIMNSAFGSLSDGDQIDPRSVLPFDLGYRRVMTYFLPPKADKEAVRYARLELIRDFRDALKPILGLPAMIENIVRPVMTLHHSFAPGMGQCYFDIDAEDNNFYELRAGYMPTPGREKQLTNMSAFRAGKSFRLNIDITSLPVETITVFCEYKTNQDKCFRIERDFKWIIAHEGPKIISDHRVYRRVAENWLEIKSAT